MPQAKRLETVIGENIRRLRNDTWSQTELGAALGALLGSAWSRSTVSQAEAGKRSFIAAEMVALARVFKVGVPELYKRHDAGDVIISDSFVLTRTELMAQTSSVQSDGSQALRAVDILDRSHAATQQAMNELRTVERSHRTAIDLLSSNEHPERA